MKNLKEVIERIREQWWNDEIDYDVIGVRFEDKERQVGDICERSRHNSDREDEREFPEYGTEEYEEMALFDGTSAWNIHTFDDFDSDQDRDHCYIIAGDRDVNKDDDLDVGEVVIEDAVVIEVVY
ncbi:hypothetical protein CAI16_05505 [Virgibacillus dokdonensis]|uniref:Uncharacterized protein n=1 Tax=Virgibacillus dokdonensis TaxID=302167 RepID=A0A3E0WW69_9BACI|nr:hypothetical protein [Virgibacillus dokdonensis]RFA36245.1 hypothetical protein CAI16_05505 [Virgibacillus dokdonensis]